MIAPSPSRRMPRVFALLAFLVGYTMPLSAWCWPSDPSLNVPVCTAPGNQTSAAVVPDGAGGVFIAWTDARDAGTGNDIYVSRLMRDGALSPGWPVNGRVVCNASGSQVAPAMIPDDAGGVIITWEDHRGGLGDIYVQRVTSDGAISPGWSGNGVLVGASAAKDEIAPQLVSDGADGAIVVWTLVFTAGTDLDVYANHVTSAGAIAAGWSAAGVGVDPSVLIQDTPSVIPDGSGGAIIAYEDNSNSSVYNIDGARVTSGGVVVSAIGLTTGTSAHKRHPVIMPDGLGGFFLAYQNGSTLVSMEHRFSNFSAYNVSSVTQAVGTSEQPVGMVSDGVGGGYLTWVVVFTPSAIGLYEAHFTPSAVLDAGNSTAGSAAPPLVGSTPFMVSDGSGGLIMMLPSDANQTLIADHRLSNGTHGAAWPAIGTIVSNSAGTSGHHAQSVASDGSGGAIAAWTDMRFGNQDIYAQRVDHFGQIGDVAPVIAQVKDVPNDQGGQVRVSWSASYLDADPTNGISSYVLFRQAPASAALAALRAGTAKAIECDDDGSLREPTTGYLVMHNGAASTYWEQIATIAAQQVDGYSFVAPTTGDSVAASNPRTLFMTKAIGSNGYWFSAPDSGYSVDNLAPTTPAPFTGIFQPGTGVILQWSTNHAPDFSRYRLYKGYAESFIPGPGNLVAELTDPNYVDPATHTAVYKLSAVDIHGNESPFASATLGGTTAVETDLPDRVELALGSSNPAAGPVVMRYGLPRATDIRLAVYDVAGREVAVMASGRKEAGRYEARWSDRAIGAQQGVFFVRITADGHVLTRRVIRVR
jgi:hypothetical protein